MASRIGVKTYGRSQKVVCQSNIQFDQLFNETTTKNKPSAAKSTGTLHRWGMTSFTSLRNTDQGYRGSGGGNGGGSGGVGDDDDDQAQTKTIKRIKIAVDDDPFSFDAETDSAKANYKVTQCGSSDAGLHGGKSSSSSASTTSKVNKFFKSRGTSALSKEKRENVKSGYGGRGGGGNGGKRQQTASSKPAKILSPLVNSESPNDKKSLSYDAFSALATVSNVACEAATLLQCNNPSSTIELDLRAHIGLANVFEGGSTSFTTPVTHQNVVPDALLFSNEATAAAAVAATHNYESYLEAPHDHHHEEFGLDLNRELSEKVYCPLESLSPPPQPPVSIDIYKPSPIFIAADDHMMPAFSAPQDSLSSAYQMSSYAYQQPSSQLEFAAVGLAVEHQSQPESESAIQSSSQSTIELLESSEDQTPLISRVVPPLTIKLPQSVLSSVDFTDSGEDSLGSSIGHPTAALTSALNEMDDDSQKLKVEDKQPSVVAGTSKVIRSKPSLVRSASASFSVLRSRRIFNNPQKKDKKAVYKHRPWQAEEEPIPEITDEQNSPQKEKSLVDEFDEFEEEEGTSSPRGGGGGGGDGGDEEVEGDEQEVEETRPVLTRVVTWPTRVGDEAITSIRCPKKMKKLYTVVRNVKQAHQCHESGETQEFNDDIEYLLDGLQEANAVGTRCLSILSLAGKCMAASFRMHLRAHGTLTKVFSALHDAPKDSNMSLCTSTMMFVLSQDRLNMDLERESLELMLQLLDTETRSLDVAVSTASFTTNGHGNRDYDKNRLKVRELCDQLQKKGHAKHLDLDNITSGMLAMETLLSLTSRRAGEWFKEELRELGGLDHLVNTVSECGKSLPDGLFHLTEYALDKLRKLDRCLKVLENVTIMNVQNQSYLLTCQSSSLVYYCTRALKLCERSLLCYPTPDNAERDSPSWILFSCVLSVLKVLLNLTNDNAIASTKVGEQDGLMQSTLACVLYVPAHLSMEQRFELLVLSLGLLINLVEHSEANRQKLFFTEVSPTKTSPTKSSPAKSSPMKHGRRGTGDVIAPKALVNLFMEHEAAARLEEAKTDSLLDGKGDGESNVGNTANKEDGTAPSSQDDIEETLTKALQKAGKNMEDSMVAAYIALLLGCLIQDNRDNATKVREHLPNRDFDIMVKMLKKFLNFMHLANVVGSTGMKSIQRVIDILQST